MAPKLLSASAVRNMCGGVSDMTIHRWLKKDELGFPRPIYIANRRYWREAEILDWIDAREAAHV